MNSIAVSLQDSVVAGQQIGTVGSTGTDSQGNPTSTGPHLDFVVMPDGSTPANPLIWLPQYQCPPARYGECGDTCSTIVVPNTS